MLARTSGRSRARSRSARSRTVRSPSAARSVRPSYRLEAGRSGRRDRPGADRSRPRSRRHPHHRPLLGRAACSSCRSRPGWSRIRPRDIARGTLVNALLDLGEPLAGPGLDAARASSIGSTRTPLGCCWSPRTTRPRGSSSTRCAPAAIARRYLALVRGVPKPAERHDRSPDRTSSSRRDSGWRSSPGGRPSVTHYEVLRGGRRRDAARGHARDRAHAPDPGPPRPPRSPGAGGPDLRRRVRGLAGAGARPPLPPCLEARVPAPRRWPARSRSTTRSPPSSPRLLERAGIAIPR